MVHIRNCVRRKISSVVSTFLLLGFSTSYVSAHPYKDFYVGLWYGPTISEISEFKVGVLGETKRALPSLGGSRLFDSDKFDWQVESDPVINFNKTSLYGLRGGIGYNIHGMRIEAEFGHERHDIVSRKGGGAFLLAKTAALNVLTEQGRASLPLALESFTVEEIGNFGQYMQERLKDDPSLKEVYSRYEEYKKKQQQEEATLSEVLIVVAHGMKHITSTIASAVWNFWGALVSAATGLNLPEISLPAAPPAELSEAESAAVVRTVMTALVRLAPEEEKVKFAQAISSALEGAEVVEIGHVRTVSMMLNACYDFPQVLALGWYMSPYVCAGGGGSVVSLGRGHADLRPAYRVKFGVNYSFSETFSMFAGGVYHRVLGKRYDEIPVRRMEDDLTFPGRTKESASASFKLRYWGIEVGVRYAF